MEQNKKLLIVPTDHPKVFRIPNPNLKDTNNVYLGLFYVGPIKKKEKIALSVM